MNGLHIHTSYIDSGRIRLYIEDGVHPGGPDATQRSTLGTP